MPYECSYPGCQVLVQVAGEKCRPHKELERHEQGEKQDVSAEKKCPLAELCVIVKTSNDQLVGQAEVEVVELNEKGLTDKDFGYYDFGRIAPGDYIVMARKDWHLTPDSKEWADTNVKLGESEKKEVELTLDPIEVHMYLDNDRDGKISDDLDDWKNNNEWKWGKDKKGAIILCNNDDEDKDKSMDYENKKVDTDKDLPDVAPLVLRKSPKGRTLPKSWKLVLSVSDESKIRIFQERTGTGNEKIGPKASKEWDIEDLDNKDEIILGMEATQYPVKGFDGIISLKLELKNDKGTTVHTEPAKVRIAPWIIFNHFDPTEKVYVVETGDNSNLLKELEAQVKNAGLDENKDLVKAPKATYGKDPWMQDAMEIGFSTLPNTDTKSKWHLPVVLRTANDRVACYGQSYAIIDKYPKDNMLGPGFGFTQALKPKVGSSLDSFGNLECTPPFIHSITKKDYKFGRIYYGEDSSREMQKKVVEFLTEQKVQDPFHIDTSWLVVGHVDEVVSFCPMKNAKYEFKVLIASPDEALKILRKAKATAKLFEGIKLTLEYDSADLLAGYPKQTVDEILKDTTGLMADQAEAQKKIDGVRDELKKAIGIEDDDFIHLPVLFKKKGGRYIAYTPDVVNSLVLTKVAGDDRTVRLCIPKPFGPKKKGKCAFEKDIEDKLGPSATTGVEIKFIDDFVTYHRQMGEIHCGTNSKRKPPEDCCWWEQKVK